MGGAAWSSPEQPSEDLIQSNLESTEKEEVDELPDTTENSEAEDDAERNERKQRIKVEIDEFHENLEKKREERKLAMSRITEEMNQLRSCKDELEREKTLRLGLERQVKALKEVATVSNEMLQLRETQVNDMKRRLNDSETNATESLTDLRLQYEKQIENIQKLRALYEERTEAIVRGHESAIEKERAKNTLLELKLTEATNQAIRIEYLSDKVRDLEEAADDRIAEIEKLKDLLSSAVAENKNLTAQLKLINNLFSNLLTGNELDFDLLTTMLQDNHNLITDLIVNGDINETAAVLFNIAEKVYKKSANTNSEETDENVKVPTNTKEEIASNLPKVWRVLIELLSRHIDCSNIVQGGSEECYKDIQTPHGSRTVISVSQTFLRLKDLILEKNCLVKEVGRLKTLNGHLDTRLDLQERRLSVVCSELRKTWGVVSKLKVQHRQLHTHKKILRYELHHKRQMLTELKNELKYCRETWDRAREKNIQTEHDWEILRKEFALRKSREASNSAESGYEDDETSQSPDVSTSDSDYEVSDSQKSIEELEEDSAPSLDFEDAASDATVIELIDMLDLDSEDTQDILLPESFHNETSSSSSPNHINAEVEMDNMVGENLSPEDTVSIATIVPAEPSEEPSSSTSVPESHQRSQEEILNARSERLRRLEMQCCSLLNQMSLTSFRSDTLSMRLEELHEQYGSEERQRRYSSRTNSETEDSTPIENNDLTVVANEPNISSIVVPEITDDSSSQSCSSSSCNINITKIDIAVTGEQHPKSNDDMEEEQESKSKERAERVKKMEEQCMKYFQKQASITEKNKAFSDTSEENLPEQNTENDCNSDANEPNCVDSASPDNKSNIVDITNLSNESESNIFDITSPSNESESNIVDISSPSNESESNIVDITSPYYESNIVDNTDVEETTDAANTSADTILTDSLESIQNNTDIETEKFSNLPVDHQERED